MSFYHTDEKFKLLDSKPIYESCQASVDLKKDTANDIKTAQESYANKSENKQANNTIKIDGFAEFFYQR